MDLLQGETHFTFYSGDLIHCYYENTRGWLKLHKDTHLVSGILVLVIFRRWRSLEHERPSDSYSCIHDIIQVFDHLYAVVS